MNSSTATPESALNVSNSTISNIPSADRLAVMWSVDVVTVLSNIPVFILTPRLKMIPASTKVAMIMLALTDVGTALHRILRWIIFAAIGNYSIEEGSWLCWLDGTNAGALQSISVANLIFISIDRFLQIKYPLIYSLYVTQRNILLIELGICLFYYVGIPVISIFHPLYFSHVALDCRWRFSGLAGLFLSIGFIIQSLVVVLCCLQMFFVSRRQLRMIHNQITAVNQSQNDSGAQVKLQTFKVIKTLLVMTLGYFACWTPHFITIFCQYKNPEMISELTEFFCIWLAFSNSANNPWIYVFVIGEYRSILLWVFFRIETVNTD